MLKHITLSMAGQLGLVLRVGGVLLGVGIVGDALGSGTVPGETLEDDIADEDILTEDGIATGLEGIVGIEESVQETPVGYSKYNNYVRAK